jgi:hypothetical protein
MAGGAEAAAGRRSAGRWVPTVALTGETVATDAPDFG